MILQPVAPPPVANELKAHLQPPRCTLPTSETYPPQGLEIERQCFATAERRARDRHTALSAAVLAREAATAEFIKKHGAAGP